MAQIGQQKWWAGLPSGHAGTHCTRHHIGDACKHHAGVYSNFATSMSAQRLYCCGCARQTEKCISRRCNAVWRHARFELQ